jgi:hypothetical protein
MSALGQKQTFEHASLMSALPPKADIAEFSGLNRRSTNNFANRLPADTQASVRGSGESDCHSYVVAATSG